jgi:NADH-quinone oxidoreductase subunit M
VATASFDTRGPRFQLTSSVSWIPDFGVSFALGVDGIALVMLLLVGVLVPVVIGASWDDEPVGRRSMTTFFAWLLLLEATMVGVFAATDVFLFYVFFEAMLVPMYFLIGSFGGPRRQYAAVKFFLYSLVGGLVMLAAVIGLYVVSAQQGEGSFAFDVLNALDITPGVQKLLFLGFFVAFAIKAPLVPLHTWLPDAAAEAPIGGAVILVGVLDKVGTFGFLRYCLPLFPDASRYFAPFVLVLAVAGVLYAALLAMGQSDMKRLVAYTSIAHFGFIALGIFTFTTEAGTGAVTYMLNHGVSTGLLFIVVGMLIARGGSRRIGDYGGVAAQAPVLAGVFLVAGLATLSLPGTSSFVSELLVLIGSFPARPVFTIVATIGIILAALYVLLMYQRTMHGPARGLMAAPGASGAGAVPTARAAGHETAHGRATATATATATEAGERPRRVPDLSPREVAVVAPLVALIVVLGVYPQPLIDLIEPAVAATVDDVGGDPGGVVPHTSGAQTEAGN